MTISVPTGSIPTFYRGTALHVVTAEVINPSGAVIPSTSTLPSPMPMVQVPAPFTNALTGDPQDPTTVTLMVRCEGKRKIEYTYGGQNSPINRLDVGMYEAVLATQEGGNPGFGVGLWTIEWAGTGGIAALKCIQVLVQDPPVIPSWL